MDFWSSEDKKYPDLFVRCFMGEQEMVVVQVTHKDGRLLKAEFKPEFRPIFGLDYVDACESQRIAVGLADGLMAKEKPPGGG